MKICIDPGHGGADPGAVGPTGLKEKDVNLVVAKQVAELLKPICTVVMTRTSDIRLGNTQRADLQARVAIAEKEKADRFLSIHCNSFSDRNVRGIETFAYGPGGNGEKLARAIQAELIRATGLIDRKVKFSGSSIYVLKYTSMSAVLTETGFISNPTEEKLLRDPAFQAKVARAIAQGVANHIGKKLPESAKEVGGLENKTTSDPDVYLLARARASKADNLISKVREMGFACKPVDPDPDMLITIRVRTSKADNLQKEIYKMGFACNKLDLA